jgi:hypothetical protein
MILTATGNVVSPPTDRDPPSLDADLTENAEPIDTKSKADVKLPHLA